MRNLAINFTQPVKRPSSFLRRVNPASRRWNYDVGAGRMALRTDPDGRMSNQIFSTDLSKFQQGIIAEIAEDIQYLEQRLEARNTTFRSRGRSESAIIFLGKPRMRRIEEHRAALAQAKGNAASLTAVEMLINHIERESLPQSPDVRAIVDKVGRLIPAIKEAKIFFVSRDSFWGKYFCPATAAAAKITLHDGAGASRDLIFIKEEKTDEFDVSDEAKLLAELGLEVSIQPERTSSDRLIGLLIHEGLHIGQALMKYKGPSRAIAGPLYEGYTEFLARRFYYRLTGQILDHQIPVLKERSYDKEITLVSLLIERFGEDVIADTVYHYGDFRTLQIALGPLFGTLQDIFDAEGKQSDKYDRAIVAIRDFQV